MRRLFLGISAGVLLATARSGAGTLPEVVIDWSAFLARQDLVWSRIPTQWRDSVFIGNGNLGATVCLEAGTFGWQINRADVTHESSRYPIGRLVVRTAGALCGGEARLKLWDAEAEGTLRTERGSIHWRTFTATTPSVLVIELKGAEGESGVELNWEPAEARPPRKVYRKEVFTEQELHPAAVVSRAGGMITSVQSFLGGGAHAECVVQTATADGGKLYFISISPGATGDEALAEARRTTDQAVALGLEKITTAHREWWHAYYPQSFLSIPEARLEAFYWIQIYKLGAAMRENGPILDLMGPWFAPTPWSKVWWNLNVQLTYSPLFTANRLAPAESLFRALDQHRQQLGDNVPKPWRGQAAAIGTASGYDLVAPVDVARGIQSGKGTEMGNLPWVLFLYWQYYAYQQDEAILRDRVLPLLKLTIGHYLAVIEKGEDGRWHLPLTYSPELLAAPDCNYDLALLRWGLQALITASERVQPEEPLLPRWKEVLAGLTPFPTDATGLLIGRGQPLKESHRHYSHLLAIYPLQLLNPDEPTDRALIETSLANWTSRPEKFKGYSHTGAASMEAMLGHGDGAEKQLQQLLNRFVLPNTFYMEAGPVIETPLSAATSLQEMLLQSGGGRLRIFPAIPSGWPEVSFHSLRGEGAFLVSAVRHEGRTAWVQIQSLAGAPCRVQVGDWKTVAVRASSGVTPQVKRTAAGLIEVSLSKGETVVLTETAQAPLIPLRPVASTSRLANPYPMHFQEGRK